MNSTEHIIESCGQEEDQVLRAKVFPHFNTNAIICAVLDDRQLNVAHESEVE